MEDDDFSMCSICSRKPPRQIYSISKSMTEPDSYESLVYKD